MVNIDTTITIDKKKLLEGGVAQFLENPYSGESVYSQITSYYYTAVQDVLSDFGFNVDLHYDGEVETFICEETEDSIIMNVYADWFSSKGEKQFTENDFTEEVRNKIIARLEEFPIFSKIEISQGMPTEVFEQQMAGVAKMLESLGADQDEIAQISKETRTLAEAQGW